MRRVISFLCACLVCLTTVLSVSTYHLSAEGFAESLTNYLGHVPTPEEEWQYSYIITTLRTDGISDAGIAGILGNVKCEAGGRIFAIEGYGGKPCLTGEPYTDFQVGKSYDYGDTKPSLYTNSRGLTMGGEGIGICQWSFGRANGLSDFAKSKTEFGHVTVKHWVKDYDSDWFSREDCIPDIAGQALWMLQEMNSNYTKTKDAMTTATDARAAARVFHDTYEGSAGWQEQRADFAEVALAMIQVCDKVSGEQGANASSEGVASVAQTMVDSGYWSEDQIVSYSKLNDIDSTKILSDAQRGNLKSRELESLTSWEDNIAENGKQGGLIYWVRIITMLFGILLIIWSVIIYLAYWFDRLNTLIEFDKGLLGTMTLGRLRISDTEEECTFRLTESRGDVVTVNHRAILTISVICIFFGVLIVSGLVYKAISWVVWRAISFLH